MAKTNLGALAIAALMLTACQPATTTVDTAKIEAQLQQNEVKWNQAYASRDAATLAGAYADDAALANPGSPLVTGIDAIRKETGNFASDPNLRVQFASDRIQVAASGDLAYTRGHYTMTTTNPATRRPEDSAGSYLTVWQRQSDGTWKAVEDFVTPGPAAAE